MPVEPARLDRARDSTELVEVEVSRLPGQRWVRSARFLPGRRWLIRCEFPSDGAFVHSIFEAAVGSFGAFLPGDGGFVTESTAENKSRALFPVP